MQGDQEHTILQDHQERATFANVEETMVNDMMENVRSLTRKAIYSSNLLY